MKKSNGERSLTFTKTAQIQLKNLNDLNIEMYFKSIKECVSARTYNDIYYKLKTIFEYAKSLGAINTDLLKSIKTKKIQKKEKMSGPPRNNNK